MIAALAMERFLAFARGFRSQFARLEKAVGVALVLTGVAFLTGGRADGVGVADRTVSQSGDAGLALQICDNALTSRTRGPNLTATRGEPQRAETARRRTL